jgi:hypothetical protein
MIGQGNYGWEDFEEDMERVVESYRATIETALNSYDWDRDHAPYIVPLLYYWNEPEFEDEPIKIKVKGVTHTFLKTK